jgi:hypothetical protein
MKKLSLLILFSLSFSQRLDQGDVIYDELRAVVETASRSNQRVFVDDFTGLL